MKWIAAVAVLLLSGCQSSVTNERVVEVQTGTNQNGARASGPFDSKLDEAGQPVQHP